MMMTYKLRPAYGSNHWLIEFGMVPDQKTLVAHLLDTLQPINAIVGSIADVWMNDEVWITMHSNVGEFTLTYAVWDTAFIMAESNQAGLLRVDAILSAHADYTKEAIDVNDYKTKRK